MSLFPVKMESERLRYKRLHMDDFDPWELYKHARSGAPNIDEITEHVMWNPYNHPKEAFDWVERCTDGFEAGDDATYVIRPKEGEYAGEVAGLAALGIDWNRRLGEMGTWLRKPFWGRGYSGERAGRFLELAFDQFDLEVVAITVDPENDNSRRAIEKYIQNFGGQKEGRLRNNTAVEGAPRDDIRYSITLEEWKQNCE